MSAPHNAWFIQVEGQVYGPYTDALMKDYVSEGRIIAASLITADPSQGFVAAERYPHFSEWQTPAEMSEPMPMAVGGGMQRQVQPVVTAKPQIAAQPTLQPHVQPQQTPSVPAQAAPQQQGNPSVFVIMAELRSGQSMNFLQALQGFGPVQRIGDTVWLLRCPGSVQALRNALSQTLSRQDRLFIVDSFSNETAWFNIGADMDTRIRELWSGQL